MKCPLLLLALLASGCGETPSNFSGRWLMIETDREYQKTYSKCWLEIEQEGDRVTVRAWRDGQDWKCEGRGGVEGDRLRFRWAGDQKHWRGTCELVLANGELRGVYQREDVSSSLQYCRGRRQDR